MPQRAGRTNIDQFKGATTVIDVMASGYYSNTVLPCISAPVSELAPPLEYRCTEVTCNMYDLSELPFSTILKMCFFGYRHMHNTAQLYGKILELGPTQISMTACSAIWKLSQVEFHIVF